MIIHLHRGLTSSTNERYDVSISAIPIHKLIFFFYIVLFVLFLLSLRWQLNFQCGWRQICIDTVETANPPVGDILEGSVVMLFEKVTTNDIF